MTHRIPSHRIPSHRIPSTTHTVEMQQIAELDARLQGRPRAQRVTAEDLGLTGFCMTVPATTPLQADAELVRVSWDGSPEFPYVRGHFRNGDVRPTVVEFHSEALRHLSRRLGARHIWGVGSVPDPVRD
jgi:hypothetical protein